ncbi:MAG TPA: hypothetical protein VKR79_07455 [Gaiellaceae bacterium]|nr:hypothetical protein [Gaiellaceae bacterium]
MSDPPVTLRPSAKHEWLVGAYYRAYALHKDNMRLPEALALLTDLRNRAEREADPESALRGRIERLHGQVLIRMKDPSGRQEIVNLFMRLGGRNADAPHEAKEHARLLSDLCRDLTLIGLHDEAVELATRIAERPVDRELHAFRLTNLAAWLLQRAVARRLEGKTGDASRDLDAAAEAATAAYDERLAAQGDRRHDQSLELRECEAVRVSTAVERGAIEPGDLSETSRRLVSLLAQTPDFSAAPETRLQIAYRVGRLGVAHVLSTASTERDHQVGLAYLRYAWDFTHNQVARPWLPFYIAESLCMHGSRDDGRAFAATALERLIPQAGPDYIISRRLQEIASGIRTPRRKRQKRA